MGGKLVGKTRLEGIIVKDQRNREEVLIPGNHTTLAITTTNQAQVMS